MGWQDLGRESLDMLRERLKRSYPSYHPTTQAIVAVAEKKENKRKNVAVVGKLPLEGVGCTAI